jgi:S1-C subfamily serine protease
LPLATDTAQLWSAETPEWTVIGIPTLSALDPEMGAEAPGIGFAIDSSTVRQVADALVRSG